MTLNKWLSWKRTDRELIVELYAEGLSYDDLSEKFDYSKQRIYAILKPYLATQEEIEAFKRAKFKKNLNRQNR